MTFERAVAMAKLYPCGMIRRPLTEAYYIVARLAIRSFDDLEQATRDALAPVAASGPIANVWLEFASSEPALRAYLAMERALDVGTLLPGEIEAIKLRVSTLNSCAFCVAVHRKKARDAGLSRESIAAAQVGEPTGDERLDAMLTIVGGFFNSPGTTPDELISEARAVGVDDAALMDLAMAVSAIFFTNIANHINDT
jgi:AhpD family alkylhydroperoxidase